MLSCGYTDNKRTIPTDYSLYSVNSVSLSVYDTLSVAKLTEAKRHALELVRPSLTLQVWLAIMKNLAEALAFSQQIYCSS